MIGVLLVCITPLAIFSFGMRDNVAVTKFNPSEKGWWEVDEGIFAQWCNNKHKCPDTPGMLKNTYRLHVWCKDNDCGNITAFANIYNGKIIVSTESANSIADRGDQLILSFTTDATGNAVRLVRFSAEGGTDNPYPLILNTNGRQTN